MKETGFTEFLLGVMESGELENFTLAWNVWFLYSQYILDVSSPGDHSARLRCTVDIFSQVLYYKTKDVGKKCWFFPIIILFDFINTGRAMALIECRECGKEISKKAEMCLNFGSPTKWGKKETMKERN